MKGSAMKNGRFAFLFTMLLFLTGIAFAQNETDFEISIENGKVTITGYKGEKSGALVIPEKIQGMPVTVIGERAFAYGYNFSSVTIPDSVIEIGKRAFSQIHLSSIIIPASVRIIGERAFYFNRLTSVTVPDSVSSIGLEAFAFQVSDFRTEGLNAFFIMMYKNEVTITRYNGRGGNVIIPERINDMPVVAIESSAFTYSRITSITIPDTVRTIGSEAFAGNSLTEVNIPNSVKYIGHSAFFNNNIRNVTIPHSIENMGVGVFSSNPLNQTVRSDLEARFGKDVVGN